MHHLLYFLSVGNLVKPYSKCSKVSINQSKVQSTILRIHKKVILWFYTVEKFGKCSANPIHFDKLFSKLDHSHLQRKMLEITIWFLIRYKGFLSADSQEPLLFKIFLLSISQLSKTFHKY